jgi:spore photoproduct lyase
MTKPQVSSQWKSKELFIHNSVRSDDATKHILSKCAGIPVQYVDKVKDIVAKSKVFKKSGATMLKTILAGKKVMYVGPASPGLVDEFTMPDDRILCPHFARLKLASNGCFYQCDWCYLKLTYRGIYPYITVRAQYNKIERYIEKRLKQSKSKVIFNSGEMADSLSLEHITGAAEHFIPFFGRQKNGYLFMLTKSGNVDDILNLPHKKHTIVAWSLNNDKVSKKFEIGAPTFKRRLKAAKKVQDAGYPVRARLDPIVPFNGWEKAYSKTVHEIFDNIKPERITLGTLRFEANFYKMRNTIFTTGKDLPDYLNQMEPMFPPKQIKGKKRPSIGKYSFSEKKRIEIFDFIIKEIRKYSECKIALCKESENVWSSLGMDSTQISCACQLN